MTKKHRLSDWLKSVGAEPGDLEALGLDRKQCSGALKDLQTTCRDAWECGLLRGFNGNMSVRLDAGRGHVLFVTGTGVAKGHLKPGNISLAREDGTLLFGAALSSETAMHVAVYRRRRDVRCILHVHPAALLALSLRVPESEFLHLPLFEAAMWREKMVCARAANPGTEELAQAVAEGFADGRVKAVFMREHGLCSAGKSAVEVLGVCEQLEHLATTQIFLLS